MGVPLGEFRDHAQAGGGGRVQACYELDRAGALALRGEVGLFTYGLDHEYFLDAYGDIVPFDITNNVAMFNVGPELRLRAGAFRPHASAALGLARFYTSTSAGGYTSDTQLSSTVFETSLGVGAALLVHEGERPVSLDLSLESRTHSGVNYLPGGKLMPDGQGGYVLPGPVQGSGNLLVVSLGVRWGLR